MLKGKHVTITLKTGARFSGILSGTSTAQNDLGCILKWAKQIRGASGNEEVNNALSGGYIGGGPDKTVIFESKDLVEIHAEKVALGDSDIVKSGQNGKYRALPYRMSYFGLKLTTI